MVYGVCDNVDRCCFPVLRMCIAYMQILNHFLTVLDFDICGVFWSQSSWKLGDSYIRGSSDLIGKGDTPEALTVCRENC